MARKKLMWLVVVVGLFLLGAGAFCFSQNEFEQRRMGLIEMKIGRYEKDSGPVTGGQRYKDIEEIEAFEREVMDMGLWVSSKRKEAALDRIGVLKKRWRRGL
jgi:hypothetical protein